MGPASGYIWANTLREIVSKPLSRIFFSETKKNDAAPRVVPLSYRSIVYYYTAVAT